MCNSVRTNDALRNRQKGTWIVGPGEDSDRCDLPELAQAPSCQSTSEFNHLDLEIFSIKLINDT
jgi:hypothetical protein